MWREVRRRREGKVRRAGAGIEYRERQSGNRRGGRGGRDKAGVHESGVGTGRVEHREATR